MLQNISALRDIILPNFSYYSELFLPIIDKREKHAAAIKAYDFLDRCCIYTRRNSFDQDQTVEKAVLNMYLLYYNTKLIETVCYASLIALYLGIQGRPSMKASF